MRLSYSAGGAFLSFVLLLLFSVNVSKGHESCCKHKIGKQQIELEYIDDPDDTPPRVLEGQPQYIDDPNDVRPDDWDDEDDGEWAPVQILNPEYQWKPRKIPNPNYVPPPTYWEKLLVEIRAVIPWVTLGVLITGGLSMVTLPVESFERWLCVENDNSSSTLVSWFNSFVHLVTAAVLGLATPLCSCGALPLAAGLVKRGIPFPSVLSFLTASQSAGLDSAAITYGLLGAPAMLGRLGGAICLALATGWFCPFDAKNNRHAQKKPSINGKEKCHETSAASGVTGVVASCLDTAVEIYPTVFLGLALSTAALHFLPAITSYISSDSSSSVEQDLLVRSILLLSTVPLQLCEHTSVTLAAAIQKAGGSPGLAFSFLLSAPATNLATLLWLWRSGYRLGLLSVLFALCGTALMTSYSIDALDMDLLAGESTGEMAHLPECLLQISPYLAVAMSAGGFYRQYRGLNLQSQQEESSTCCSKPKSD